MNRIRFDEEVLRHPEEFSHITVPTMEPDRVPRKGKMKVRAAQEGLAPSSHPHPMMLFFFFLSTCRLCFHP